VADIFLLFRISDPMQLLLLAVANRICERLILLVKFDSNVDEATVADPLTGHSTPKLKLKMINENSHYT
jgi:hypothetical protein